MTLSTEAIAAYAAEAFDVPVDGIMSPSKCRSLVRARRATIWLAARHTRRSYAEIADAMGRHRKSVLEAIDGIERDLRTDLRLAAKLRALSVAIGGEDVPAAIFRGIEVDAVAIAERTVAGIRPSPGEARKLARALLALTGDVRSEAQGGDDAY